MVTEVQAPTEAIQEILKAQHKRVLSFTDSVSRENLEKAEEIEMKKKSTKKNLVAAADGSKIAAKAKETYAKRLKKQHRSKKAPKKATMT
ncbi:hypothetical protein J8273_1641 [Carpediemonas membranifera]|uniref:Uncharacterized protein n=1 Tax=Carpediemonas membranifera TaxID=201153 RepID=A0A8J6E1P5_9EUKA|nr:hypothetical protein J8273_1641 [Carpediemonas membranifera]|eukprot:KAG9396624.1 hypothetical protein J8273_1641 [Carpediemonas membranifera]